MDFLSETTEGRRQREDTSQALKDKDSTSRSLHPANLSFPKERGIKTFHDKQKLN